MAHKEDSNDPAIPLMLWLAYEPKLAAQPQAELDWLKANAAGNPLITDHIVSRATRRLAAGGKPDDLAAAVAFAAATSGAVRVKALDGLVTALQGRMVDAPTGWADTQAKLLADADQQVKRLTRTLAGHFRDPAAVRRALAVAIDGNLPAAERIEAIRVLGLAKPPEALAPLLLLAREPGDVGLRAEAVRAVGNFDSSDVPKALLDAWAAAPPAVRTEIVNALAARKAWARDLLAAVAAGKVEKTALNANTVLRLRAFKDKTMNAEIEKVWGRVRDTPAELAQLIDRMRGELSAGPASFARGKAVFENQCAKCHTFEGRGHTVGPQLDGAGRDIEYILVNVLDPNRVVGQPYFVRRLSLKNGRIEEGLLAAEDPQTITLKGENDALRVFARKDVETIDVVERSMMPEGLDKAMSVQDFRDLVRYVMAHPFVARWTVAGKPVVAPVTGRVELPPATQTTTVRLTADVTAPAAMKTRLQLGAANPLRVWLNDKLVYDGRPGTGAVQPDQAGVDVELTKGVNRLAVEVRYRGEKRAVYARFLDPDRKLAADERR